MGHTGPVPCFFLQQTAEAQDTMCIQATPSTTSPANCGQGASFPRPSHLTPAGGVSREFC